MMMKTLMIMLEGLESWKRDTRTRRTLIIMSEGSKAGKGHQDDENANDYVRGFDELKRGH